MSQSLLLRSPLERFSVEWPGELQLPQALTWWRPLTAATDRSVPTQTHSCTDIPPKLQGKSPSWLKPEIWLGRSSSWLVWASNAQPQTQTVSYHKHLYWSGEFTATMWKLHHSETWVQQMPTLIWPNLCSLACRHIRCGSAQEHTQTTHSNTHKARFA